jgi:hypothetical protein
MPNPKILKKLVNKTIIKIDIKVFINHKNPPKIRFFQTKLFLYEKSVETSENQA